jgi:hypothetical protein
MKYLLQRRHLAPTHKSNLYIPDPKKDPLVIDKIPDFFITGHIHRVSLSNYKNITMVNCSCWTDITEDSEKRGLQPQPAKVPIINLKTREVKIINFAKPDKMAEPELMVEPVALESKNAIAPAVKESSLIQSDAKIDAKA